MIEVEVRSNTDALEAVRTRIRAVIVLLLAIAVTAASPFATAPATAQDSGDVDLTALPGLRQAVSRTYAFDVSTLAGMITTPGATAEAPSGTVLMVGVIAEFDTPENAAAAATAVGEASFAGLDGTPVADLGAGGTRYIGGEEGAMTVYVAHDAQWLAIAIVTGTDDSGDAARGLIAFALAQEVAGEAQFHADGSSQGGLWSKLPGADDEDALAGTRPLIDTVIFPREDAGNTPAA